MFFQVQMGIPASPDRCHYQSRFLYRIDRENWSPENGIRGEILEAANPAFVHMVNYDFLLFNPR